MDSTISKTWHSLQSPFKNERESWTYSGVAQSEHGPLAGVARRSSVWRRFAGFCLLFAILSLVYWSYTICNTPREVPPNASKHLVVASFTAQDVSWFDEIPTDWAIKRYVMDDPHPDPSVGLGVPKNYGREAMAYLTYIIDHYDILPDYVAMIHGHYQSWHQPAPMSKKLRALNLTALENEDYISFRCGNNMGCERRPYIDKEHVNWDGEIHLENFWQYIFNNQTEMPRYISYKCCGQHAITRRSIQKRSRDEWIKIREPLMLGEEELRAVAPWARDTVNLEWTLGTFYEKIWHLLFGTESEYCPTMDKCNMEHFSNAIICAGDEDLTPYEHELWRDNICVSAFDDVAPSTSPNWTTWNHDLIAVSADIRSQRNDRLMEQDRRLHELETELEEAREELGTLQTEARETERALKQATAAIRIMESEHSTD